MYEVDFSKPIHIHFIGIGGISMSGLAEILLKESFTISGSDAKESDLTRHLTSLGAQVFYGQKAENILPGTDLVVYTAAIHPDNTEFAAAKAAGVPGGGAVAPAPRPQHRHAGAGHRALGGDAGDGEGSAGRGDRAGARVHRFVRALRRHQAHRRPDRKSGRERCARRGGRGAHRHL